MNSVTWPIKPHTLAKHELLRGYLEAWFPIVSRYSKKIIYLDAFAGPGVYAGGEPGSPLIALKTLIMHERFPKMSETEFLFKFIEKDNLRCQNLEKEINKFWLKQGIGQSSNVKYDVINNEFLNVAQDVLNELKSKGATLAPTLAFVDPFGWSNIRLDLMMQFVSFKKCEIIITFMVESISRFLSGSKVKKSLQEFFGTDKYEECISLSGNERIECLRDLYVNQLEKSGSFEHVRPFEMVSNGGKTKYYLIHCTRKIKGLRVMKDVMWNVDKTGSFKFEARWMGRQDLFASDYIQDLKKSLIEIFKGREVTILDIESFVLTDTPYTIRHIRPTLSEMENKGIISAYGRPARSSAQATLEGMEDQKRKTYPPDIIIRFL